MRVSLTEIVDALESAAFDWWSFVNRATGEIVWCSIDHVSAAEEGESPSDGMPAGERELLEKAREVVSSDDWIRLPGPRDIDEYGIMERFVDTCSPREQGILNRAMHGKGAFRRFKDALVRLGLLEAWYRFRRQAFEDIALKWLEEHQIPFDRGPARHGA
jgi:hypothetical protein